VSRRDLSLLGGAVLILVAGLLIGQRTWRRPDAEDRAAPFRVWFWESRSLDLFVQVGLILCGALGIAALLPEDGEEGPWPPG